MKACIKRQRARAIGRRGKEAWDQMLSGLAWKAHGDQPDEEGLGQRGARLEARYCLGYGEGTSLESKGTWRSWGPMTLDSVCSPLKGSFNQRPVAVRCVEPQRRGGLEGGWLETGKYSLVMCFLPGSLSGRTTPDGAGRARYRAASSVSIGVRHPTQNHEDWEMPPNASQQEWKPTLWPSTWAQTISPPHSCGTTESLTGENPRLFSPT